MHVCVCVCVLVTKESPSRDWSFFYIIAPPLLHMSYNESPPHVDSPCIPQNYDPTLYTSTREWVTAEDGTQVPVLMVAKNQEGWSIADGVPESPRPVHLYG